MQFGPESLLPPVVAIVLAILTRKVVLPLAAGVFTGALLLAHGDPERSWYEAPSALRRGDDGIDVLHVAPAGSCFQFVAWGDGGGDRIRRRHAGTGAVALAEGSFAPWCPNDDCHIGIGDLL